MIGGEALSNHDEALTVFLARQRDGRLEPLSLSVAGGPTRLRYAFPIGATLAEIFVAELGVCLRGLVERIQDAVILKLPDFAVRIGAVLLRSCRMSAGRPIDGAAPVTVRFERCEGAASALMLPAALPPAARPLTETAAATMDLDIITDCLTDSLEPLFALREAVEAALRRRLADAESLRALFHDACAQIDALQDRLSDQLDTLYALQNTRETTARLDATRPTGPLVAASPRPFAALEF